MTAATVTWQALVRCSQACWNPPDPLRKGTSPSGRQHDEPTVGVADSHVTTVISECIVFTLRRRRPGHGRDLRANVSR